MSTNLQLISFEVLLTNQSIRSKWQQSGIHETNPILKGAKALMNLETLLRTTR